MDSTERNNALRLIDERFRALDEALDSKTRDFGTYWLQCRAEEKQFRKYGRESGLISVVQAAKLMALQQLATYMSERIPSVADIFSTKLSHFQAASLVARFLPEISEAVGGDFRNQILRIDYGQMMG